MTNEEKPDDCLSFYQWLDEENLTNKLSEHDLNLLRIAWNAGVENACSWFGSYEGVTYDAEQLIV